MKISVITAVYNNESSNADSIYANLVYVKKNNINKVVRYRKIGIFKYNKLKCAWMPPPPTFFVKRKVYEKYGVFDISFRILANYDKILRFLGTHKISITYLLEILIKMRLGRESNKSLKNLQKKTAEDFKALKKDKIGGYFTIMIKNIYKLSQFLKR